ncbi:MAG: hypothetical protein ACLQLE_11990 [Desulfobaccales bacterium]
MPELSNYPRVLVIDAMPFTRRRNNGIVKSNLFQGWPKSRLAQIDYSNDQPGFDVCDRYWRLKKTDILKGLFGKAPYAAWSLAEKDLLAIGNSGEESDYDDRPQIERRLSFLNPQWRELIGEAILRLPSVLSAPVRRWIDSFQPDIIFSNLGKGPILRLVVKVSQRLNLPILPYFTDDWVANLYKDHFLGSILRRSMLNWFSECLRRAPIRLTASDHMSAEYTRRYGGRFEAMLYPEELNPVKQGDGKRSVPSVIQFLFLGSLEPDRWRSLRHIGEALWDLHSLGVSAELSIYAFPSDIEKYRSYLTMAPVMRIVGTASPSEVAQLQRKADVLVHVESFAPYTRQYTKYSLSTKIPQYMMARTCIFAYGPGEVASLRYLRENGTGMVVGEEDQQILRLALTRLITDVKLRQTLAEKAYSTAVARHEAGRQRACFHNLVREACESWSAYREKTV